MTGLFDSLRVGPLDLPHRVLLAPMTRMRADDAGGLATDLMLEFYRQRSSAGLLFTEGNQISPQSKGYAGTPGLFTAGQVRAWRRVTDAVHAAGGRVVAQLLHVGRVSHPLLLDGRTPVSAGAAAFDDWVTVADGDGGIRRVDCGPPRALAVREIAGIVEDYRHAARQARAAGFDLVEVHAAHGYLLHQFLSRESNPRGDRYGGSTLNRARFTLEVLDAVIDVWDAQHVGLRVSPVGRFCDLGDPDGAENALHLARECAARDVGWLHVSEPDWAGGPAFPEGLRRRIRRAFHGPLLAAGGYTAAKAGRLLADGTIDAAVFGRAFLANPDLPARLAAGRALTKADPATFYGGGARGYVDYAAE